MQKLVFVVLMGVLGAFLKKERCEKCGSKWRLLGECPVCERHVCGECGSKVGPEKSHGIDITTFEGTCCSEHLSEYEEELERHRTAAMNSLHVEVYSKKYRGKVPEARFGKVIETEKAMKDKDDAERRLRYLAALEGAECVVEFEFVRHTAQDGNYRYATWTAVGVI